MSALIPLSSGRSARSRKRRATRPLRVALLGCGNIGGALATELAGRRDLAVCAALVRDPGRARTVAAGCIATTFDQVLASRPDIVVECMGGIVQPAQLCVRALEAGIHVVSANKSMVAHALPALSAAAQGSGARLRFDAAVCAGVPVLESVARLRPARVQSIRGIVNGTCNFILHAMAQQGVELQQALADATARGYAEPDPSADLSGRDSAEKLCLLAAAAGICSPSPVAVETRGIAGGPGAVDRAALQDVRALGHSLRLVAHLHSTPAGVTLRVAPTVVAQGGALSSATGTQNVVVVQTELAGQITLTGPGAGAQPTVAALLADILACAEGGAGWAQDALSPPPAPAQPVTARWLVRVGGGAALTPDALATRVRAAGAAWRGAAFLSGRTIVELEATGDAEAALCRALREGGAQVQSFVVDPEVALRF